MKKVLIIGAGMLQAYVIQKAKEMGYYVLTIDMDSNAIGFQYADEYEVINIVNQEECLQYAKKKKIDGVLTAATDYGVLTTSYIARELKLNGLDYNVAKIIKNKYEVRKIMAQQKVDDTAQFFEVKTEKELNNICNEINFPVIVKPVDGSGSKGVSKAKNKEELLDIYNIASKQSLSHKVLIETFIIGQEYGVESFVLNGNVNILGIMKKHMTKPPYYAELGHSLPAGISSDLRKKIEKVVTNTINALNINFGSVNMDLLVTSDEKVYIVDIGCRMGGNLIGSHVIPYSTGIEYMENIIRACVGDELDFQPKLEKCISTRILALTPGIVKELPDFNKYMEDKRIKYIFCKLKKGEKIETYRNNLDGCGYVVVEASTIEEAERLAEEIKQKIDKDIKRQ